jgi:hypothetical protein
MNIHPAHNYTIFTSAQFCATEQWHNKLNDLDLSVMGEVVRIYYMGMGLRAGLPQSERAVGSNRLVGRQMQCLLLSSSMGQVEHRTKYF